MDVKNQAEAKASSTTGPGIEAREPFKWGGLAAALPLLTGMALVASVAYDYSFFWALGLSLDEIPSTLSDHVRSAVVWSPKLVLSAIGYATIALFLKRVEGGLSEEELVRRSRFPRFTRWFRRTGDRSFTFWAVLVALLGPFLSTSDSWMIVTFLILWGMLMTSIISHPTLRESFSTSTTRFLLVSPILLSVICLFGYSAGARIRERTTPAWEALIETDGQLQKMTLLGVRQFQGFAIFVTMNGATTIVPSADIQQLSQIRSPQSREMNVCKWLNLLCKPKAT